LGWVVSFPSTQHAAVVLSKVMFRFLRLTLRVSLLSCRRLYVIDDDLRVIVNYVIVFHVQKM
jgi:hypothetical protein